VEISTTAGATPAMTDWKVRSMSLTALPPASAEVAGGAVAAAVASSEPAVVPEVRTVAATVLVGVDAPPVPETGFDDEHAESATATAATATTTQDRRPDEAMFGRAEAGEAAGVSGRRGVARCGDDIG
jgi:hypothetical protein